VLSGVKDDGGLEKYLSKADFEKLFPHRNKDGNADFKIYEYENLLAAAKEYPLFASEGSDEIRRREVAAFLANIAQETTGGWDTAPGGRYVWGLYFLQEVGTKTINFKRGIQSPY
jgi:chitinase